MSARKTPAPPAPATPAPAERRRFRGVSLEDRQAERRKRLVEAAIEVFGRGGYHGATVRQICVEAGLTERYFYESFESREALFAAAYQQVVLEVRERILQSVMSAPRDPGLMARAGLHTLFASIQDDPRLARILFVDVLTVGRDMEALARQATGGFGDLVKQLADNLFPQYAKAGYDTSLLSTGLVGAFVNVAMRWTFNGFKEPLDHVVTNCAVLFEALARYVDMPDAPPDSGSDARRKAPTKPAR